MKSKSAWSLVRSGSTAACLLAAALFATRGAQASAITWNLPTGGNWNTTTSNWTADGGETTTTFTDTDGGVDHVTFDKTNGGAIVVAANMSPLSTTVSAASGTYTFSGGPIDSGALVKSGAGTLRLDSSNSFSGVTLNGGTLQIGNAGVLGTGPLNIYGGTFTPIGGTRTINPSAIHIYGDFNIDGPGNTFYNMALGTGGVTLYNGTRTITSDTNNGGAGGAIGGIIGDGGNGYGLTKAGNGILYLNNSASTYSGKTTVLAGAVQATSIANVGVSSSLGQPATVANGTIDFSPGTTFRVFNGGSTDRILNLVGDGGSFTLTGGNNGTTTTYNSGITATNGTGAKTVNFSAGAGNPNLVIGAITDTSDDQVSLNLQQFQNNNSVTLNGVNTFTGPITLTSQYKRPLVIGGAGQLGSGNYAGVITITDAAASLEYSSSAAQTLAGAISGAGKLTLSGAGTLTLSNTNTYTGATAISDGTLKLAGGSLANTAIAVSGSGTLAVQPGSATAISAGNSDTAAAGATLNLGARILDMTDGFVSAFNLVQESTFPGTALTVTDGASLKFNLAAAGADLLAVTKAAAVSGTVNVTIDTTGAGSLTPGTYNLITAASGLGGGTWQFTGGGTTQEVIIGANTYQLTLNAGATAVSVTVTGSGTPYDTWANGTFVPPLTAKLPGDNQDSDSLNNLQEFAFGTQPTVTTGDIVVSGASVTPGAPKIVAEGGNYYMVFGRRKDYVAAKLTYTVEFTAGLNFWGDNDDVANPPESLGATDGTIDAMRVLFPPTIHVANGDPKPNYARVRVVMAQP